MRNYLHCFSQVDGRVTPAAPHPGLDEPQILDFVLNPGEILFLPIGCLHYVEGLDISVTVSFTNFVFDNDSSASIPRSGRFNRNWPAWTFKHKPPAATAPRSRRAGRSGRSSSNFSSRSWGRSRCLAAPETSKMSRPWWTITSRSPSDGGVGHRMRDHHGREVLRRTTCSVSRITCSALRGSSAAVCSSSSSSSGRR